MYIYLPGIMVRYKMEYRKSNNNVFSFHIFDLTHFPDPAKTSSMPERKAPLCLRVTLVVQMIANVSSTPAKPLSIVSSNNGPPGRRFNHGDVQLATMRETPHRESLCQLATFSTRINLFSAFQPLLPLLLLLLLVPLILILLHSNSLPPIDTVLPISWYLGIVRRKAYDHTIYCSIFRSSKEHHRPFFLLVMDVEN